MLKTNRQLSSLQTERERLLDAWRSADPSTRSAILNRIEDIDEQIEKLQEEEKQHTPRLEGLIRRFKRR